MISLPEKAYKYMKLKWLRNIETTNEIFINHLNNYPEDKYGTEIGDDLEGTTSIELQVNDYTSSNGIQTPKEQQMLTMLGIGTNGKGTNITIKNSRSVSQYKDNNYFVYCVSLEKDSRIQREFGNGLQIIHDFKAYIEQITFELNKLGIVLFDAGKCRYFPDRKQHFTEDDFTSEEREFIITKPYLVKEKKHEYQKEFRVIWRYLDNRKIVDPITIVEKSALRYSTTKVLKSNKRKGKTKK